MPPIRRRCASINSRGRLQYDRKPVPGTSFADLDRRRLINYFHDLRQQDFPDPADQDAWVRLLDNTGPAAVHFFRVRALGRSGSRRALRAGGRVLPARSTGSRRDGYVVLRRDSTGAGVGAVRAPAPRHRRLRGVRNRLVSCRGRSPPRCAAGRGRCWCIRSGSPKRCSTRVRRPRQHQTVRRAAPVPIWSGRGSRLDVESRHQLYRDYVDVAVLRDVVERHQVRNVTALRWLMRHLLGNAA